MRLYSASWSPSTGLRCLGRPNVSWLELETATHTVQHNSDILQIPNRLQYFSSFCTTLILPLATHRNYTAGLYTKQLRFAFEQNVWKMQPWVGNSKQLIIILSNTVIAVCVWLDVGVRRALVIYCSSNRTVPFGSRTSWCHVSPNWMWPPDIDIHFKSMHIERALRGCAVSQGGCLHGWHTSYFIAIEHSKDAEMRCGWKMCHWHTNQ